MAGANMDYLNEDPLAASDPPQTDSRYGGPPSKSVGSVTPFGGDKGLDGVYDRRDELVGGTDSVYNMTADGSQQSGADWASYSDSAPSFVSGSGLGGERTKFSDTLGPDDLAEGKFSR
jgi:hypothetical protein